jgi:hypothetical protein
LGLPAPCPVTIFVPTFQNETTMKTATLLLLISAAYAEQYSFDFSDFANPTISQPGKDMEPLSHRMLQGASCGFEGDKLLCEHAFEVTGQNNDKIVIQFTARCDADSQVKFNYQRAANCQCQAMVASQDGSPPKICPCTVCQAGFGDVPVNVDCTLYEADYLAAKGNTATSTTRSGDLVTDSVAIDDTAGTATIDDPAAGNSTASGNETTLITPYVVGTCTSIDCGAACNGTCDLNCANSGTACPYCENAAQNQPTMSPTGGGNGEIPGLEGSSGVPVSGALILSALTISLAVALM